MITRLQVQHIRQKLAAALEEIEAADTLSKTQENMERHLALAWDYIASAKRLTPSQFRPGIR